MIFTFPSFSFFMTHKSFLGPYACTSYIHTHTLLHENKRLPILLEIAVGQCINSTNPGKISTVSEVNLKLFPYQNITSFSQGYCLDYFCLPSAKHSVWHLISKILSIYRINQGHLGGLVKHLTLGVSLGL